MPAFRRSLIAVFAVTALLFGLVAMHAMHAAETGTTASFAHEQVTAAGFTDASVTGATMASTHPPDAAAAPSMSAQGCFGMCTMDGLVAGMMCALSILAIIVGLLLARPSPPRFSITRFIRILRVAVRHVTPASPPSLHVLSISRT